jgi:hypothetical protein
VRRLHGAEAFFQSPVVKAAGVAGAMFFLGLAIGNGWQTREALQGQGRWYRGWCGQQVHKTLFEHEREDHILYGAPSPK